jgi:hypothetical protein
MPRQAIGNRDIRDILTFYLAGATGTEKVNISRTSPLAPMLDEIEWLTHSLDEHTFMIPGKIAAIRAGRLREMEN